MSIRATLLTPIQWHSVITNSTDVLISDFDVFARSTSKNQAKNLDGWDTYRSDNIIIQNSYLDHDDDCVSFKPNSTNVIVQGELLRLIATYSSRWLLANIRKASCAMAPTAFLLALLASTPSSSTL